MREFESGATRDSDDGKFDYEGFLAPGVLMWYAAYMHRNRIQADGEMRASDNWQKGIPRDAYMSSMFRHFMEAWTAHRQEKVEKLDMMRAMKDALPALLFNVMGYMFELQQEALGRRVPELQLDLFSTHLGAEEPSSAAAVPLAVGLTAETGQE